MKSISAPFPVYDRLVLSGMLKPIAGLKFFDASQAFEVIPPGLVVGDLGPVIPPYESMWLEGEDVSEDGVRWSIALHVVNNQVFSYATIRGQSKQMPIVATFTLTPAGTLDAADVHPIGEWASDVSTEHWDLCAGQARRSLGMALFALSLMHCRNVKQEHRAYVPQPRRKSRRVRPAIEYRVIHLPGSKAAKTGQGNLTGATRLHTARGHFKTYTEESPLMGKHVGTYYWGWQVRGRKENGEVISSYKVGEAA